jgi:membrane-associated protease RseP (regulator of RpoE activity)
MTLTILAFLVAIGVLVAVHEFGHFWMARRLGIRVLRFSIGFGKVLWSRRGRDGCEYADFRNSARRLRQASRRARRSGGA